MKLLVLWREDEPAEERWQWLINLFVAAVVPGWLALLTCGASTSSRLGL